MLESRELRVCCMFQTVNVYISAFTCRVRVFLSHQVNEKPGDSQRLGRDQIYDLWHVEEDVGNQATSSCI